MTAYWQGFIAGAAITAAAWLALGLTCIAWALRDLRPRDGIEP